MFMSITDTLHLVIFRLQMNRGNARQNVRRQLAKYGYTPNNAGNGNIVSKVAMKEAVLDVHMLGAPPRGGLHTQNKKSS